MNPNKIQDIISGAKGGGWDWFAQANETVRQNLEVKQAQNDEDAKAIASAWAKFYRTPGGRKALDRLFDTTLRRTVFFASLGLDLQSMAVFGAFREGQNALAHEIARQIGKGLNEDTKPRDT